MKDIRRQWQTRSHGRAKKVPRINSTEEFVSLADTVDFSSSPGLVRREEKTSEARNWLGGVRGDSRMRGSQGGALVPDS